MTAEDSTFAEEAVAEPTMNALVEEMRDVVHNVSATYVAPVILAIT